MMGIFPITHRHLISLLCLVVFLSALSANGSQISITPSKKMKIAFCLTGQLARFEILSKIKNIFFANADIGNVVNVFIILDANVTDVKQTFWRYDYSTNPYSHMNSSDLKFFIDSRVYKAGYSNDQIRIRAKFAPPPQRNFSIRGSKIPVSDKTGPDYLENTADREPAAVRFQNNMRWLAGMRECVKWIQATEYEQKWFYDLVVRLRDDSFAFGPWLISEAKFKGGFVSTSFGANFGVNDHNFVVDRYWADSLLRGVTEDYYFNQTLDLYSWGNPERRIYKVATMNLIPLRNTSMCEQPLVPLRGRKNETHWRLHPTYAQEMAETCEKKLQAIVKLNPKQKTSSPTAKTDTSSPPSTASSLFGSVFGGVKAPSQSASILRTVEKESKPGKARRSLGDATALGRDPVPARHVQSEAQACRQEEILSRARSAYCCNHQWLALLSSGSAPIDLEI